MIILGTPIWVNATPAIRTYAKENFDKFKQVAFFCTAGGSGGKSAFEELEQIIHKKPVATMKISSQSFQDRSYSTKIQEFTSYIKTSSDSTIS